MYVLSVDAQDYSKVENIHDAYSEKELLVSSGEVLHLELTRIPVARR